jgi:hypothetical protein
MTYQYSLLEIDKGATGSRGIDQKMQKSSQFCFKRIDEVELKR